MKISILLICYNQEKYINKCIDSIIMQQIPFEYEVIVADDGSSDDTVTIINTKLLDKVSNLRILDNSINHGISKNYQRAFAECKGEYIAVMEGDDYWTNPNRLLKHINFLDVHRECVMSMNRYTEYNESSNFFSHIGWHVSEEYKYITGHDMACGNKLGNLSACVFRKNEIDKIKSDLYNLEIADWMLGLVLCEYGYILLLKDITSVRRVHDKGEWSKMSIENKKENLIKSIDTYNKYLNFKYDKEFSEFKFRLNNPNNLKLINKIDFVPPIFKYVFKLFMPKIIKQYIKKFI